MFALGFLSNEEKTRLATFVACYIAFVKKQKVYFMANETSEEDMRSCIQEWMEQALDIEDLAKIYATIISETDKQLSYMAEQITKGIAKENN